MNALFVVNWEKEHVAETVSLWTRAAVDLGIQPVFLKSDQAQVTFTQPVRVTDVPAAGEIDLVLTFGGDGTMIRALDMYAGLGLDAPFWGSIWAGWDSCLRRMRTVRSRRLRRLCTITMRLKSG